MIFVTVGTHQQPFDRLLRAVDALEGDESRLFQTGHSRYHPVSGQAHPFMAPEQMVQAMQQARVIVCHGGTGSIIQALELGKCPLVAPRRAAQGEHVDDHQQELSRALAARGLVVLWREDIGLQEQLDDAAARRCPPGLIKPAPGLIAHMQARLARLLPQA
jgi:UDP-N-acetylglucosamine transferase subunit ALG13